MIAPVTVPDVVPDAVKVWPIEVTEVGSDQVVPASSQYPLALVVIATVYLLPN